MFAAERQKLIRNMLTEQKRVEVSFLSQFFNVSEVTIRKDLEKLEIDGFLQRTHGGAILASQETISDDSEIKSRETQMHGLSLNDIAITAARMIEAQDIIMLISGEITLRIADLISDRKNLTVLTNDLNIADKLFGCAGIRVVMLGGDLHYSERALYGPLANANLKSLFVSKVFIEVDGISVNGTNMQFMVSSSEKASLTLEAMANSTTHILLCSKAAFSRTSFYKIGDIQIADRIITNTDIDESIKKAIFNNHVPLYTSVDLLEGFARV